MKYVEDIVLENGEYLITTWSIGGVSDSSVVGQTITINSGSWTDQGGHGAFYRTMGDQIKFAVATGWLTGKITTNTINIQQVMNNSLYIIVMEKI